MVSICQAGAANKMLAGSTPAAYGHDHGVGAAEAVGEHACEQAAAKGRPRVTAHARTHARTHTHTRRSGERPYPTAFALTFEKILKSKEIRLSILKADKNIALHISRFARFLAWPGCHIVRWDDQSQYPEVTITSFVGQSSMGLLCPPSVASKTAQNTCPAKTLSLETGCTNTHTHTHTHHPS